MVEQTAVALLFDDATLSAHLRDALVAHGARIVYESDLGAFAPAELVGSSPDVVVVDLDDPRDVDLDRLYDIVEGSHPRLVFNDADVTRRLEGWDRARWARHLAAKLVGETRVDPPRPDDARAIEPRVAAIASPLEESFVEPLVDDLAVTGSHGHPESPLDTIEEVQAPVSFDLGPDAGDMEDALAFSTTLGSTDEEGESVDPADLAAELEALLADSDAASLHGSDGLDESSTASVELNELAALDLSGFEVVDEEAQATREPEQAFDISRFTLSSLEDVSPGTPKDDPPSFEIESRATQYAAPPVPEWDLIDHDTITVESATKPGASTFGIETMTAAEFLAQDVVDDGSHGLEAGLSLELVSMEEAVKPRTDGDFSHEMFLEGSSRAVRRVVALAGVPESEASLLAFLAALPARLPATILIALHHEDDPDDVAARLGRARVASAVSHTEHGDVLLVPRGQHVQIRRDGSVTSRDDGASRLATGPSIDGILSTLAGGFGADALAIVFAGRGNDAVAGSQAIYDGGGRVWVETVPPEDEAGHMVAGVREERVAAFAGDARALAAKLIEELS